MTVLRLAAEGLGDREIAHRLRITPSAVHQHLSGAYWRLGVDGRIDAFRALGWLQPHPDEAGQVLPAVKVVAAGAPPRQGQR